MHILVLCERIFLTLARISLRFIFGFNRRYSRSSVDGCSLFRRCFFDWVSVWWSFRNSILRCRWNQSRPSGLAHTCDHSGSLSFGLPEVYDHPLNSICRSWRCSRRGSVFNGLYSKRLAETVQHCKSTVLFCMLL